MLNADENGTISVRSQCVKDVLLIVIQGEAAVREPQHSVIVGTMSGQEAGAARRARWRNVEGVSKQDPFGGELL
jgi:hypothetical protein